MSKKNNQNHCYRNITDYRLLNLKHTNNKQAFKKVKWEGSLILKYQERGEKSIICKVIHFYKLPYFGTFQGCLLLLSSC